MQPQTSSDPSHDASDKHGVKRSKLLLLITLGIVGAAIIVATVILFIVKPGGAPGDNKVSRPATTVAGKPYLYACNMFTLDAVAKALQAVHKDKAFVSTTDAFSTNNKPVAVLDLTKKDEYGSSCTYYFDVAELTPAISGKMKQFDVYAVQYKDEATAQKTYEQYRAKVTSPKQLSSFASSYIYEEQDENSGKKFLSASVLRGNVEIIVTSSTDFGLDANQQTAAVERLLKQAFERIDTGRAKVMPDFNSIKKINNQPASDVCTNLDIARVASALSGIEFRPTDIQGSQNLTELTDSTNKFKKLESSCGYRFRTPQDSQDTANAELAYDERYGHLLSVSKQVYGSEQDAQAAFVDIRQILQSPTQSGDSRGEYAEVSLGEGGARVINRANNTSVYTYYVHDKNNIYRITVTSNTDAKKSFVSKGVEVTDEFIKTVFDEARR